MSANELSRAASPYLLQHAHNPVHWRMWTKAALQEAQDQNKPILLSVGYAACHWCHVMAHESFEDADTAAVMNELFVNIKVDREERPDIDHIYMSSLQAFGERGGWPLTMFLTPNAEPFWGGTYFPKVEQYGRPAFVTVLKTVAQAFHAEPDRIAKNTKIVREGLTKAAPPGDGGALTLEQLNNLAPQVVNFIDQVDGGLRGAPKFPNTPIFELLWRAGARLGKIPYRDLVRLTLTHMSEGGIYDHLGGGYARYSTDERWLAPHFEKMLYDNAQILELLALCYDEFHDDLFLMRARETVGWLTREMTNFEGAFCASLDADSEGVEGKFYVWTWEELVARLGQEDASFFGKFYNASRIGNWAEHPHGEMVTILNRLESKRPTAEEEARLAPIRQRLFEAREKRIRPGLDDKIMADWNGLMIAALVNAATLLNEPEWIALAARAYQFIVETMQFVDAEGKTRLAHSWRAGVLVKPGLALDHAAMIRAALALHEARNLPVFASIPARDYLGDAIGWAEALEAYHVDAESGLLCMAAADATDVILRLSPTSDDAIPNAHPVYLSALVRLAGLSGDARWLKRVDALFQAVAPSVRTSFVGHAGILNALDLRLRAKEIVTAGPKRLGLYEAALGAPFIDRIVMDIDRPDQIAEGHPAKAQAQMAAEAAAFVCSGGACSLPVRSKEMLLDSLK
ncbi:thioredoxin domain-containing protein [Methylocapsa polymorpha]|uniref:Thioredoxin domain-containing protein n=1 Tax=Methylocapsa polymorpha TaxID=3080828 RepID=A0ABZ0HWH9_9HYPH|nr:thioredoxin domain-containing protein [Methylocapsa sp. RX1]